MIQNECIYLYFCILQFDFVHRGLAIHSGQSICIDLIIFSPPPTHAAYIYRMYKLLINIYNNK